MPAKQYPRNRGHHRPHPNSEENEIQCLTLILRRHGLADRGCWKVSEGGDEADAGGVAAGEGEVVSRNGDVHAVSVVVERAGSAEGELYDAQDEEIEEEAENEGREEGAEKSWGKKEGEGYGEEEAEVGGELEDKEEEGGEKGLGKGVKLVGEGRVHAY